MTPIKKIANFYKKEGYQWKFQEGLRVPTEQDIDDVIGKAMDALSAEPDNTQLEVGRLVVMKRNGRFEVYVHVADL